MEKKCTRKLENTYILPQSISLINMQKHIFKKDTVQVNIYSKYRKDSVVSEKAKAYG